MATSLWVVNWAVTGHRAWAAQVRLVTSLWLIAPSLPWPQWGL
jgi:hypothetical protein